MGFFANCANPSCRASNYIGIDLTDVGFVGFAMNVAVTCYRCGQDFDAAPGGDGAFSTIGGRLQRLRSIADELTQLDRDSLSTLNAELQAATKAGDKDRATAALKKVGAESTKDWLRDNQHIAVWLALILQLIATILSANTTPSSAQLDQICQQVLTQTETTTTTSTTTADNGRETKRSTIDTHTKTVERNAPCPCGSGLKYKKCHGRHPADREHPDNSTRGAP